MNENLMNPLLLEDKSLFYQYINNFIERQKMHKDDLDNSTEAFYYLLSDEVMYQDLSSHIIIETANKINKLNELIANGFRTRGEYIYGTNIKIPDAKELPFIVDSLLTNYNMNILDDVFLNEAMLHIGLITSHPFEDGNHRTAHLITNYNLIKQRIAPIIISEEIREMYYCLVYSRDLDSLANLFRELSKSENKYINSSFLNNGEVDNRHY